MDTALVTEPVTTENTAARARSRRGRLTARRVRAARRRLERDRCAAPVNRVRHKWVYDGYFWFRCPACGQIS